MLRRLVILLSEHFDDRQLYGEYLLDAIKSSWQPTVRPKGTK